VTFARKIIEIEQRLDRIRSRSGQYPVTRAGAAPGAPETPSTALDESLDELAASLAELRALETELQQRNQALHEMQQGLFAEQRRYQDLFEFAPDAYLISDHMGVIQEANHAACELFWTPQQSLLKKPLSTFLLDRSQRAELSKFMADVRQATGARTLELELKRVRSGGSFPANFHAAPMLEQGRCVGIRWMIRDITEQKRAARDAELVALVAASTDPIISLGLDGCIQSLNPAAERLYGYSSRMLMGRPVSVLFSADRVGEFFAFLEQVEMRSTSRSLETIHVTQRGATLQVQVNATVIRDGRDHPKSIAMFVHDISASKQIENLLRERAQNLFESDRRKNVFLGLLAHELRNPLSAVLGALELIGEPLLPSADRTRSMEIANRQLGHMRRLLDDLLDMTRIATGRLNMKKARLQVDAVLDGAVASARLTLAKYKHKLSVVAPRGSLELWGDEVRLVQVLVNLLNNAAKYTDPGGAIELSAARDGQWLVVRLRDSGIGLGAELLPRLFQTFVQADSSFARSEGGLGLGLALVDQIVRMHGGRVLASSAGEGCGSSFTLELPLLDD
jgi:two-component system CheB/CheR fusion protein